MNDNQNNVDINEIIYETLDCKPNEFYKKYKNYKKAEAEFKKLYEPFKQNLLKIYETETEIPKSITIEGMKLTYVSASIRNSIDSKKLKEEEPELAKKFTKTTNVAATLKIEDMF